MFLYTEYKNPVSWCTEKEGKDEEEKKFGILSSFSKK